MTTFCCTPHNTKKERRHTKRKKKEKKNSPNFENPKLRCVRIGFGRVFFIITMTDTIPYLENFGGFSGIIFTSDYYAFKCDQIQGQVCPCCSNNAHNKNNYHTSIINTRRPGCWYYHILFFFAPFVGKKDLRLK